MITIRVRFRTILRISPDIDTDKAFFLNRFKLAYFLKIIYGFLNYYKIGEWKKKLNLHLKKHFLLEQKGEGKTMRESTWNRGLTTVEPTYRIYSINRPGRLLNFWTSRVGAYSSWAPIRGWVLIKFSTFSVSVVYVFCNKTINGNNKTRRCNKARFL